MWIFQLRQDIKGSDFKCFTHHQSYPLDVYIHVDGNTETELIKDEGCVVAIEPGTIDMQAINAFQYPMDDAISAIIRSVQSRNNMLLIGYTECQKSLGNISRGSIP